MLDESQGNLEGRYSLLHSHRLTHHWRLPSSQSPQQSETDSRIVSCNRHYTDC